MRIINQTTLHGCKITFYSWNNRYIIKLEQGLLEQTFKIDEFDLTDQGELLKLVDAEFVQQAVNRFNEMGQSVHEAKARVL